jgi:hypothetical protein
MSDFSHSLSLQATRDGAFSSAIAVHADWSRVPELWTLGVIRTSEHNFSSFQICRCRSNCDVDI